MFVRVLRDFDRWKAGECYDVGEDLARFLTEGADPYAKRVNVDEYHAATRAVKDKELAESIQGQVRGMFEEFEKKLADRGTGTGGRKPEPPNGGGGVNFAALAGDPNDQATLANQRMLRRIDKTLGVKRTFDEDMERTTFRPDPDYPRQERYAAAGVAEVLDLVGCVGHPERHKREKVEWAEKRLRGLCAEFTEQNFNESSGKWDTKTTHRQMDGSLVTVTRTGTDSVSGGTTYGFVVKPEYLGNIFEISSERQVFADAAQQVPMMSGNEVKWPAWDQYTAPATVGGIMQSASFAGIDLYYASENANRTLTDAALNMINFKAVDLTAFTALSRDFIVDNYVAYDSALTRMIGRAFGWMEDYMTIQGSGVGRPQGFFNAAATLTASRSGGGSTVYLPSLQNMIKAIHPMVLTGGELRWLANISTFAYLSTIQNSSGVFAFQPNTTITQATPLSIIADSIGGTGADLYHRPAGMLFGFPLYFTEKVPALGTTGDISLVAPSQYGLAKRSGLEIAVSEHYYFQTDLIAYRFKLRHDGKVLWRSFYQQADGSATNLSPFVMLHS